MVDSTCRIGIIGAGSSGIYLASLLIQQGYQVDLFEKATELRTEGCGILIVQAGMKALHQGNPKICQQIIDSGVAVNTFEFRNLRGEMINSESVTYQEDELPGILVHRKAILETLFEALPSKCCHFNSEFQSITQTEQGVTVFFKDGSHWQGDILVGADGIFSKVRDYVVSDVQPCYLGDLVWRGVVSDPTFCPDGHFIVYARGRGIYANFFDIGNGLTHWGFFIETHYPENKIGIPRPQNVAIPPQELAKLPEKPRFVIESTPFEQITCCYSYDINPLPRLCLGKIVLIGDAAHAKSPTRARGMTSGWEDALALSKHFASNLNIENALKTFQEERMPIVHEYQRTSRDMSRKIGRMQKTAKISA